MVFGYILNPEDQYRARIIKAGSDYAKRFDFKDMKFPVKFRDLDKIKKKNSIDIGYENKEKYLIYASKQCEKNMLTFYW